MQYTVYDAFVYNSPQTIKNTQTTSAYTNPYTLNGMILDSNSDPRTTLFKVLLAASQVPHTNVITKAKAENSKTPTKTSKSTKPRIVCTIMESTPTFIPYLSMIGPQSTLPTISPTPKQIMVSMPYIFYLFGYHVSSIVAVMSLTKLPLQSASDKAFHAKNGTTCNILFDLRRLKVARMSLLKWAVVSSSSCYYSC